MTAIRRILKEHCDLQSNGFEYISAGPVSEMDPFNWEGKFVGPEGTPYAGGHFYLKIRFPGDYAIRTMEVQFITQIFHPNVGADGSICLATLNDGWSPAFTVTQVLLTMYSLFHDPFLEDPIAPEARDLYRRDRSKFDQIAREWTVTFAKHQPMVPFQHARYAEGLPVGAAWLSFGASDITYGLPEPIREEFAAEAQRKIEDVSLHLQPEPECLQDARKSFDNALNAKQRGKTSDSFAEECRLGMEALVQLSRNGSRALLSRWIGDDATGVAAEALKLFPKKFLVRHAAAAYALLQQYSTSTPEPPGLMRALTIAAQLVNNAEQRMGTLRCNVGADNSWEAPGNSRGEEVERRTIALRTASEHLRTCYDSCFLDSRQLEDGNLKERRDGARCELPALWQRVETAARNLRNVLSHPEADFEAGDVPSSASLFLKIQREALTVLQNQANVLKAHLSTFGDRLIENPGMNMESPYVAELRTIARALLECISCANGIVLREKLKTQLAALVETATNRRAEANSALDSVETGIRAMKYKFESLLEWNKLFPRDASCPPEQQALGRIGAIEKDFLAPIIHTRFEAQQELRSLRHWQADGANATKAEAAEGRLHHCKGELRRLCSLFSKVYGEVELIRTLFPEFEGQIKEKIDRHCERGCFRLDIGLPDFQLRQLSNAARTYHAATDPRSQTLHPELQKEYVMKKFSSTAEVFHELTAMRDATVEDRHHVNVAEVEFAFECKGDTEVAYYLAMPYYRCCSNWFNLRIQDKNGHSILNALKEMSDGLACLHRNEIIHGDVNPNNLMFDVETMAGRPKWIDFNCAVIRSERSLRIFGNQTVLDRGWTPGYAAPELSDTNVQSTPAADVYSLGKTFAALLHISGESPLEDSKDSILWLGDATVAIFGEKVILGLRELIKQMTLANEGSRIPLSHPSNDVETVEKVLQGILREWAQFSSERQHA